MILCTCFSVYLRHVVHYAFACCLWELSNEAPSFFPVPVLQSPALNLGCFCSYATGIRNDVWGMMIKMSKLRTVCKAQDLWDHPLWGASSWAFESISIWSWLTNGLPIDINHFYKHPIFGGQQFWAMARQEPETTWLWPWPCWSLCFGAWNHGRRCPLSKLRCQAPFTLLQKCWLRLGHCRFEHCDWGQDWNFIRTKPQVLGHFLQVRHFQLTPHHVQGHKVSAKIVHRYGESAQLEPLTLQLQFFRSQQSCGVAWDPGWGVAWDPDRSNSAGQKTWQPPLWL